MRKIFLLILIVLLFSCKTSTEPEDLSYVTIKYHEGEVVRGQMLYYISYTPGGYEWSDWRSFATIDDDPPDVSWRTDVKYIIAGEDFTYMEKK